MKRTYSLVVLLAVGMVLALGATGCKKKLQNTTPLPGYRAGEVPASETPSPIIPANPGRDTAVRLPPPDLGTPTPVTPFNPDPTGTGGIPLGTTDRSTWNEDHETFKAEVVYFDFDKSNVRPDQVGKVKAVAERFRTMAAKALRIDGHCDERGTEEYNRALGERRALAVREALIKEGVAADLIDTRTYGEERPAEPGHNEAAWSKNRRGEFILLSPPK